MSRKLHWFLFSIFIMLTQPFVVNGPVQAKPAMSVGLTRFEAIPLDNAARLEWDTETELGIAGFMLKRGRDDSFSYIFDPDGTGNLFISSEGGPAQGFEYSFTDETAVIGESYTYQLIEVQVDASEVVIADTSVTIIIEATDTPIVLPALGGDGSGGNSNDVTVTPTLAATAIPSATLPTNSDPAPSATPIPTLAAEAAAPSAPIVAEVAPAIDLATQPPSSQPIIEENGEAGQTGIGSVAVAYAQEEPPGYPAPDPGEGESGESLDAAQVDRNNEPDTPIEFGDNGDPPELFGTNPYPGVNPPSTSEQVAQNDDSPDSAGSLEGKIYLWVAFIAAIVIFSAAVLGTILIYTRQRSQE